MVRAEPPKALSMYLDNCDPSTLLFTAGSTPTDLVLADMATGEYDDLAWRHEFVDERVREAVKQRATNVTVVCDRVVHLRVQPEERERGIKLGDEGTPETLHLNIVPRTGIANFRARLWPERNVPHNYAPGADELWRSSAS